MFNKKGSRNMQRSPLPGPRPAAPQAMPAMAPAVVPAVASRGASRTSPAAAPAVAPPTAYRRASRAAPVVAPRAAPPPSSRGRTQGAAAIEDDTVLTPRAALRATPGTATPPCGHRADERYIVSTPKFDTVTDDDLDPGKRYHTSISVETNPEVLEGTLFHVTGDVVRARGMWFEVKDNYSPGADRGFLQNHGYWLGSQSRISENKGYLGSLAHTDQTAGN